MAVDRYSPDGLAASGTEHGEQAALFAWVNRAMWLGVEWADDWERVGIITHLHDATTLNKPAIPELRWLHAIPNGGERGRASAGNMKAEGVKSGVADIFWPYPMQSFCGLYIELKRADGRLADLRPLQREFAHYVVGNRYAWRCCFGWKDARQTLIAYASGMFVQGELSAL